jgi:hypothetical protein
MNKIEQLRAESDAMAAHEAKIRAAFAGITSLYDTHRPALCEAIFRTAGPVIELGMGEGSTRALHVVSELCGRIVRSYDHDASWVARYCGLRTANHTIEHVATWDECPIEAEHWSVAFVDHAPAERRRVDIERLARRAQILVVHDTEDHRYGYGDLLDTFAHRFDDRSHQSWTTLLSNFVDVSHWTSAG